MPTIAWIGSIQIRVYFQAFSPAFDIKLMISDFTVISGNGHLRGRDLAAIRACGRRHQDVL